MNIEQLRSDRTIQRWLESAGLLEEDQREIDGHIEVVGEYCDHVGTTPSELVEKCLRPLNSDDPNEREISLKGRGEVNTSIQQWSDGLTGTRFMRAIAGNMVRGFLVHNGILIQGNPVL
jgi:hypothetical protein